ncbi:MAG: hypothetical protein ACE10J_09135 [Thermodesulfobacteriota bacterium]
MKTILLRLLLCLFFLTLTACGSKVRSVSGDDCYEIDENNLAYNCENNSNTGYGGYYNPEALNLFRPGRFEDINTPVW